MAKVKELGTVKVVHESGIVETDKGIRSQCKAKKGDRLIQDLETRVISVAPKKAPRKPKTKDITPADDVPPVEETETTGTDEDEKTGTDDVSGDE